MNVSDYLYNYFLDHLDVSDGRGHYCVTDLYGLTDYDRIKKKNFEMSYDDVKDKYADDYRNEYRFFVMAEQMRTYLENNIIEYYAINKWELFVRLKNGDKFIYNQYYNDVTIIRYKSYELTPEQLTREFGKNLQKLLDYKWMNQEEFAERLGTTQPVISRYIQGLSVPNALRLKEMADILECSTDDFFYKDY